MPLRSTLRPLLKKHSGLFFNVLFIVTVLLGVGAFQARNMLPTTEADIPTLRGPLLRGGNYDLADAGNRPVLVYFFAPWCNFCSASSDNLTRLRRLRDEESLEILVVALDWKDHEEVLSYANRHDLDLPVILGDSKIGQDWRVFAFPTYYVLNSNRRITRRDLGYSTQIGLWWRTWLVN
jgi:thiol-disulfide isomerase/thioredoxin